MDAIDDYAKDRHCDDLMVRNADDVATAFHLPPERVFEVGTLVKI